jgi:hypothetical protein
VFSRLLCAAPIQDPPNYARIIYNFACDPDFGAADRAGAALTEPRFDACSVEFVATLQDNLSALVFAADRADVHVLDIGRLYRPSQKSGQKIEKLPDIQTSKWPNRKSREV